MLVKFYWIFADVRRCLVRCYAYAFLILLINAQNMVVIETSSWK